jgi:hypothetical protein
MVESIQPPLGSFAAGGCVLLRLKVAHQSSASGGRASTWEPSERSLFLVPLSETPFGWSERIRSAPVLKGVRTQGMRSEAGSS